MKKLLFFLPVLVIGGAAFYILRFNPLMVRAERVKLQSASCVTESQIRSDAQFTGQNILFLKGSAAGKKITSGYVCVRSVSIQRVFPSSVEVDVEGRMPSLVLYSKVQDASVSAQVNNFLSDISPNEATPSSRSALLEDVIKDPALSYSGNSYLVDNEGIVYSQLFGILPLPSVILYNQDLRVGTRIDPGVVGDTISVLSRLKGLSIPVSLAVVKEEDLGIRNPNMSLFFALDSDLDRQLASLQLILQASTMKMEENTGSKQQKVSSIDLRFNKPVVIYSQ